jgi:hypothetical protein
MEEREALGREIAAVKKRLNKFLDELENGPRNFSMTRGAAHRSKA